MVFASSLLVLAAAGAAAVEAGDADVLGAAALSCFGVSCFEASCFAASCVGAVDSLVASGVVDGIVAVVSILKSLAVGGGTLAGSGRGIAASIASSAALLRCGSA